ncbi:MULTISPECIES: hypothetical protein [Bacillus]|uniref:hypothetical protein n=1 Tax=Bacillus TaxID=1386 RepID=UPI00068A4A29|nr:MULTISPECIES: hypothetical protein [Bacillus]MED1470210.1 hypothetical protein [Bacillus salipaludis]
MDENLQEDVRDHGNMFDQFMFGPGQRRQEQLQPPETNYSQNYIDYGELIVHLDTLVDSARNLKPLFQNIYPFIEQFWKKK